MTDDHTHACSSDMFELQESCDLSMFMFTLLFSFPSTCSTCFVHSESHAYFMKRFLKHESISSLHYEDSLCCVIYVKVVDDKYDTLISVWTQDLTCIKT